MILNGQPRPLDGPALASDLLIREGFDLARVAVMLNGQIVARADLGATLVHDGDRLEVVAFVGGG